MTLRVLQAVNCMNRAGLETMLMNYYRHMNRQQVQFDFLTHRRSAGAYDAEILALGGRVYRAPRLYPQNYPAYFAYMAAFLREHPEYRIMHAHIDAMSYFPLAAAKRAGVPVRIAHSHNTRIGFGVKYPIKRLAKQCLPSVANRLFACGEAAGSFLFGRAFTTAPERYILPNAIDTASFAFQPGTRAQVRAALGLTHAFVIGHIGRFTRVKNQAFLLDALKTLHTHCPEAVLLLVGTGKEEHTVLTKAHKMGLLGHVHLLGERKDIPSLLQAIDVFAMPSLFEGVPVSGIEAQAAGLPCIFSDRVPREAGLLSTCAFLPLVAELWANALLAARDLPRETFTHPHHDIHRQAAWLQAYYEHCNDWA